MFRKFFAKLLNFLIIKRKNRVFVLPHENCKTDLYDLLNYSGDNALSLMHYLVENNISLRSTFYLVCYSQESYERTKEFLRQSILKVVLLKKYGSFFNKLQIKIKQFSCKYWISCSPFSFSNTKTRSQKIFCLNYCTPLKSGLFKQSRWDLSYIDFLFETSLLGATTDSGEYRTFLNDCPILGFPRNDILFKNDNHKFLDWLDKNVSVKYKKIVVYAPTYRDYPGAYSNKNVLGFDDPNNELESFLEANDILLVVKYHPLQETSNTLLSPHVVLYEKTYDYSLYDALSVCDLLISDYSSVIHDFMITGKPVVLDFFDYEKYDSSRGFAFEPIDYIMPCKPCKDFRELSSAIKEGLSSESRGEQYFTVQKMFHWHIDNHSTERVFDFLKNYIK